jgi:hypothetical protein
VEEKLDCTENVAASITVGETIEEKGGAREIASVSFRPDDPKNEAALAQLRDVGPDVGPWDRLVGWALSIRRLSKQALVGASAEEKMAAVGKWTVEFFDDDGVLQWSEQVNNLVTTQGKNDILNVYANGTAAATRYASFFTGGSPTLTATYAAPVVTEITTTDLAARVALTFGTAAASALVTGTAALPILASCTLTGVMAMSGGSGVATPGNTTATGGVLLSEGTLGTAQVISTTGTVNLTYTLGV